jgi:hypothetical protein
VMSGAKRSICGLHASPFSPPDVAP